MRGWGAAARPPTPSLRLCRHLRACRTQVGIPQLKLTHAGVYATSLPPPGASSLTIRREYMESWETCPNLFDPPGLFSLPRALQTPARWAGRTQPWAEPATGQSMSEAAHTASALTRRAASVCTPACTPGSAVARRSAARGQGRGETPQCGAVSTRPRGTRDTPSVRSSAGSLAARSTRCAARSRRLRAWGGGSARRPPRHAAGWARSRPRPRSAPPGGPVVDTAVRAGLRGSRN